MDNVKPPRTPFPMTNRLSDRDSPSRKEQRKLNGKIPYASTIGSIMYVMATTQPDLALAVMVVNWYMSHPRRKHWEAIKNIFGYLWGTKDVQLTFGSAKLTKVEGYTNSDYAKNTDNLKSTSGYVFTYGGGAISWRSKLEECTTLSATCFWVPSFPLVDPLVHRCVLMQWVHLILHGTIILLLVHIFHGFFIKFWLTFINQEDILTG